MRNKPQLATVTEINLPIVQNVFKLFSKISSTYSSLKKLGNSFLLSLSDVVEQSTKVSNSFIEDFERIVNFIEKHEKK